MLLTACASAPKIETESKPGADFSRYRTFALMPLPTASPVSDPTLVSRVGEPARQALVDALKAKGLTEVDRARADISIKLKGESLPREEVTTWGYLPLPPGQSRLGGVAGGNRPTGHSITSFEERTLRIEVFDNRTQALAWVGRCTTKATGEVKAEEVQDAVRRMLAEFPAESQTALAAE